MWLYRAVFAGPRSGLPPEHIAKCAQNSCTVGLRGRIEASHSHQARPLNAGQQFHKPRPCRAVPERECSTNREYDRAVTSRFRWIGTGCTREATDHQRKCSAAGAPDHYSPAPETESGATASGEAREDHRVRQGMAGAEGDHQMGKVPAKASRASDDEGLRLRLRGLYPALLGGWRYHLSRRRMTTPEEREHACEAFMWPQGMGYAVQVIDDGDYRWLLCDDEGDPLVISSLDMIRTIARESGLVLCSVH